MQYQCPFCDYEDTERSSVEAHISGATYSEHQGKVGKLYRSDIEQNATPESVTERLFGESAQEQSIREEVENVRESLRAVKQENDALQETVENLRQELEDSQYRKPEQNSDRLDDAEAALRDASTLITNMYGKYGPDSVRRIKCPECLQSVEANATPQHSHDKTGMQCPLCRTDLVHHRLGNQSVDQDQEIDQYR